MFVRSRTSVQRRDAYDAYTPSLISISRTLIQLQKYPVMVHSEFEQMGPFYAAICTTELLVGREIGKIPCSFPC